MALAACLTVIHYGELLKVLDQSQSADPRSFAAAD